MTFEEAIVDYDNGMLRRAELLNKFLYEATSEKLEWLEAERPELYAFLLEFARGFPADDDEASWENVVEISGASWISSEHYEAWMGKAKERLSAFREGVTLVRNNPLGSTLEK